MWEKSNEGPTMLWGGKCQLNNNSRTLLFLFSCYINIEKESNSVEKVFQKNFLKK